MHTRFLVTILALWVFAINAASTTRKSTTKRRTISARTTVLFPPIQTQYRLSDITADLVNQNAGTSTFVATACSSTTISNNATCVPMMAPVTYTLAKSTLLYSAAGVGSVNCRLQVKSSTPTQTCTVIQAVYAPGVVTTGTTVPTVAPLSSTTSTTQWRGTQTGYVHADLWNDAGRAKVEGWLCGIMVALVLLVENAL